MYAIKNRITGLYFFQGEVELTKAKVFKQKKQAEEYALLRIPTDNLFKYAIVKLEHKESGIEFDVREIAIDKMVSNTLWNTYQSGLFCKLYEKLQKENKLERFRYATLITNRIRPNYDIVKDTIKSMGINRNMVKHMYWTVLAFSSLEDLMMVKVALGDILAENHSDFLTLRQEIESQYNF